MLQIIEQVQSNIIKGKLMVAIDALKTLCKDFSIDDIENANYLLLIESNDKRLSMDYSLGLITHEEYYVGRNKNVYSILRLLDSIKEKLRSRDKELMDLRFHDEISNAEVDSKWSNLAKEDQIDLAYKGKILIEDPLINSQLYFYNKRGELEKYYSIDRQLQYIEIQKILAEKEINHKRKRLLFSVVCALYERLGENINDYLLFKSKKDGFFKMIEGFYRKDRIEYDLSHKEVVEKLNKESREFYKDKIRELSIIEQQYYVEKANTSKVERIKDSMKRYNVSIEDYVVLIPGEVVNFFVNGYLWYCNYCIHDHLYWFKDVGDWVEQGTPVLSHYSSRVFSPFSGLIIKKEGSNADSLWHMLPEKGSNILNFNSHLVYGEIIDEISRHLKEGKQFDKYSNLEFDKRISEFYQEKPTIRKIDDETRKLLEFAGIKM